MPLTRETRARIGGRGTIPDWFDCNARGGACGVRHHEEPGGIGFVILIPMEPAAGFEPAT